MPTRPNPPQATPPDNSSMTVADYIVTVELDPAYLASTLPTTGNLAGDAAYFAAAVRHVLAAEHAPAPLEVGLRIISDAEIQQLHRDFFGQDYPTDVIAFGQHELNLAATATPYPTTRQEPPGPKYWEHEHTQISTQHPAPSTQHFITAPTETPYLGDIAASYETAAAQAPDYHHTALEELTELVIHGTLHLLGYEDHDPDNYELMHSHEDTHLTTFLAAAKEQADA